MFKNSITTILLSIAVSVVAVGQTLPYKPPVFPSADREQRVKATAPVVDSIFLKVAATRHMPGLVYGVVVDGKLVYSGGTGYANVERKISADARSLFRIASMSKSVTAMAILILRDEGKVDLDAPAARYIPEMKNLPPLTADAPVITVRHLLTHSAGFPEDNPWGDRQLAATDQELRSMMAGGVALSNVPGIEFEYANLGFSLLGQIVQVASGQSFEQFTTERIFTPLGMTQTTWEYSKVPPEKLALGYGWIDSTWVPIPLLHHGSYGAMGGLITTIEDWSKYVAFHISAWPPRNDPDTGPLKRSSVREMHQPWRFAALNPTYRYPNGRMCAMAISYGYGLNVLRDCEQRLVVGHGGGLPGFGSYWLINPERGIGILAFDNLTYGGTSGACAAALDTIIAMTGIQPRKLPPSDILLKRSQQLAAFLPDWKNAEASGIFAMNFFLDNRLKDLVARSKDLFEKAGKVASVREIVPENQLRGTFVIEGEKGNIEVFFTLTPEKDAKIQQVRMRGVEKK